VLAAARLSVQKVRVMMDGITAQRAREFGIEAQREGESELAFRSRVAGELRQRGHIMEAHEAYQDALYDQSDSVMVGIFGAVAQAYHGVDYGGSGERQIGDDIASGIVAQTPRDDDLGLMCLLAILAGR
jgi:hypothetical protein